MTADRTFLSRHMPHFCLLVYTLTVTVGVFTGGIWASFGIGLALVLFLSVWRIEKVVPAPDRRLLVLVLATLAIVTALNFRSYQPSLSWNMWVRLVSVFVPLMLLFNADIQKSAMPDRLFKVMPVAAVIGALALGLELALKGPLLQMVKGPDTLLFHYNRGFSYLVLLAFPMMASLWVNKKSGLLLLFIAILFIPAGLTESRAAKLALVAGLVVTALSFLFPLIMRRLLMVVPFLAAAWPFVAPKLFTLRPDLVDRLPNSWHDRIEIWNYMAYRVMERPILGWGLGTSPALPIENPFFHLYKIRLVAAPHPHNAVLQLWVELGLPGLFLGILFALLTLNKVRKFQSGIEPFAAGAWIAAFTLSMIAYNFWTDSLWAAFALTGFAFSLLARQLSGGRS